MHKQNFIMTNEFIIPRHAVVNNSTRNLPYVFVGDDAFPMGPNLLKLYSQTGLTKTNI